MKESLNRLRQFIEELDKSEFPFKAILTEDRYAKRQLLKEFQSAPQMPDVSRYISQYFTRQQLKEGFEHVHEGIPVTSSGIPVMAHIVHQTDFERRVYEITNEFYDKLTKNELDEKFYVQDLRKTPTVTILKKIQQEIQALKKTVIQNQEVAGYDKEAEILATSIVDEAKNLFNPIAIKILEAILQDDENIFVDIHGMTGVDTQQQKEDYQKLKRYFNFYLKRQLAAENENFSVNLGLKRKNIPVSAYIDSISSHNSLDFFYSLLRNHDGDFVNETIRHFESGPRAGLFDPLAFLNLWHKQWSYFESNWNRPYSVVQTLTKLRLDQEKKHILFGFILKFYGGYPISHINANSANALRFLEREFLSFPENSPEKHLFLRPGTMPADKIILEPSPKNFIYNDSDICSLSAPNDLDFYFNEKNIGNSELVFQTYDYFESGPRKGTFSPLGFLNLFWEQDRYSRANLYGKAISTLEVLRSLPLNEEQRHILFGFMLKWKGGYPIQVRDADEKLFYKLLEKEFLDFPQQTPEKDFCSKDYGYQSQQKVQFPVPTVDKPKEVQFIMPEDLTTLAKIPKNENQFRNELYRYDFEGFCKERELDSTKIFNLLKTNKLPYRIALLDTMGYLEFLKSQFANQKSNHLYKILEKILSANERKIKGNILVINQKSKENRTTYTAHLHLDKVKEDLKGL
ncbi:MAG: hypothetical protein BGO21_30885 [Dyadobacter sp. 50-39]|uniref:hypothetical protein n=1 Tax=Dyadobacter sp. 50-39 TaxID=1895756 RepID=UPI0009597927|nr:hypothetical protein [Dyadobacter sp. 50-39]OJV15402.1 MAG: hypothetical protein BGO21_30885 [Dyadobacter sp. 50-39]